ncbi:MAG: hypothetical protein OXI77_01830 [Chloroflexota bacterium]|nr:hypothetical protein [Chloroflexota bacterium]MDE2907604.1 hypothetical protein [Chloroflexota bacterium]
MRTARKTICIIIAAALSALALGQGAPSQIEAALLDLSARLGYGVDINNLSNWRWEQTNFPNDALGCPTASSGSAAAVLGYKFQLTHRAITHDYRVSNDSALVVYCGVIDPAAEAETASALAAQYSNRLCGEAATAGPYMRSRINVGMEAVAVGGNLNLRGQPSNDAQVLLQIPAAWPLLITGGPECVEGYVWWLALANGQTGYIAESGDGGIFVAPKSALKAPNREVLNKNLILYMSELGRISGNFQAAHDWSSNSRFLIVPGARGSDGVWVYDLHQPTLTPQILELDEGISALAFRPRNEQFVVGSDTGALQLWQILDGEPLTFSERLRLNAHAGSISALAFSADGERLASAGREAYTDFDVERDFAAIVWDLPTVAQHAVHSGNSGLIQAMVFSPVHSDVLTMVDDDWLRNWVTFSEDNRLIFDLQFGEPVTFLAFDYSDDGERLALALDRPFDNVLLYRYQQPEPEASFQTPTFKLTSLDFSPDGSMLVAGAAEGVFSIWDTVAHELLVSRATDGAVYDVSFSPDGTLVAVSTDRHSLILYGVPLGSG